MDIIGLVCLVACSDWPTKAPVSSIHVDLQAHLFFLLRKAVSACCNSSCVIKNGTTKNVRPICMVKHSPQGLNSLRLHTPQSQCYGTGQLKASRYQCHVSRECGRVYGELLFKMILICREQHLQVEVGQPGHR